MSASPAPAHRRFQNTASLFAYPPRPRRTELFLQYTASEVEATILNEKLPLGYRCKAWIERYSKELYRASDGSWYPVHGVYVDSIARVGRDLGEDPRYVSRVINKLQNLGLVTRTCWEEGWVLSVRPLPEDPVLFDFRTRRPLPRFTPPVSCPDPCGDPAPAELHEGRGQDIHTSKMPPPPPVDPTSTPFHIMEHARDQTLQTDQMPSAAAAPTKAPPCPDRTPASPQPSPLSSPELPEPTPPAEESVVEESPVEESVVEENSVETFRSIWSQVLSNPAPSSPRLSMVPLMTLLTTFALFATRIAGKRHGGKPIANPAGYYMRLLAEDLVPAEEHRLYNVEELRHLVHYGRLPVTKEQPAPLEVVPDPALACDEPTPSPWLALERQELAEALARVDLEASASFWGLEVVSVLRAAGIPASMQMGDTSVNRDKVLGMLHPDSEASPEVSAAIERLRHLAAHHLPFVQRSSSCPRAKTSATPAPTSLPKHTRTVP